MILKVPFHPNYSVIPWLYDSMSLLMEKGKVLSSLAGLTGWGSWRWSFNIINNCSGATAGEGENLKGKVRTRRQSTVIRVSQSITQSRLVGYLALIKLIKYGQVIRISWRGMGTEIIWSIYSCPLCETTSDGQIKEWGVRTLGLPSSLCY